MRAMGEEGVQVLESPGRGEGSREPVTGEEGWLGISTETQGISQRQH